jgi:hypothetical protein
MRSFGPVAIQRSDDRLVDNRYPQILERSSRCWSVPQPTSYGMTLAVQTNSLWVITLIIG